MLECIRVSDKQPDRDDFQQDGFLLSPPKDIILVTLTSLLPSMLPYFRSFRLMKHIRSAQNKTLYKESQYCERGIAKTR